MDAGGCERVALVHDWLTGMRGGEKCLEPLCRRWPDARLFTLLHTRGSVSPAIEQVRIQASRLNGLPGVERYYRYLLPLMPFEAGWRVTNADLVVSLSHAVAKSACPPKGVPHVCYCFTPMRYAWHMKDAYFRKTGLFGRLKAGVVDALLARIREWDRRTADRVTHFIAISNTVRDRIRDCYGRAADVIYPPVDTDFYTPAPDSGGPLGRYDGTDPHREDFYLVVSALAPYKRFDLAIEACTKLGKKLVVIGSGQHAAKLRAHAGPNVSFLGWQPDVVIRDHLRRAKALLFPGEEDFGIVPLEAQACGCPVIGFARGGLTETIRPLGAAVKPGFAGDRPRGTETAAVKPGFAGDRPRGTEAAAVKPGFAGDRPRGAEAAAVKPGFADDRPRSTETAAEPTGVLFTEQTPDAVCEAIERFERAADRFDPRAARHQAVLFRKERFERELFGYLDRVLGAAPAEARKVA